jgi:hypothetical protein
MSFMGSSLVAPRRLADAAVRWFGQVGNHKLGSIGVAAYSEPAHEYAGYRGPKRWPADGLAFSRRVVASVASSFLFVGERPKERVYHEKQSSQKKPSPRQMADGSAYDDLDGSQPSLD